ncbi:uncharacterized protein LODBEIA_P31610 [Lodderomyces beijingensis]|uniref:Proteasome component ECM29 n=1 Tax=Lodderomyces beijingensis TaxID=1775926 RepID=A0ABP0ZLA7_9ASCO
MAEQELTLLNRVELKFALAEDDRQLESTLGLYLAPVLLKLASPHPEARKLVLKMIQHIIPRISSARTIRLPVKALINQINESSSAAPGNDTVSVKLYSALFLSRGVERLSQEEKWELVPSIAACISTLPSTIAARMFSILCKSLRGWKAPESDPHGRTQHQSEQDRFLSSSNEQFLAFKISQFLILSPDRGKSLQAGLSENDINFFTTEAGVTFGDGAALAVAKLDLLQFLKSSFTSEQCVLPFLVAASVPSLDSHDEYSKALKSNAKPARELGQVVIWGGVLLHEFLIDMFFKLDEQLPLSANLRLNILRELIRSDSFFQNSSVTRLTLDALKSAQRKMRRLVYELIPKVTQAQRGDNAKLNSFANEIANTLMSQLAQSKTHNLSSSDMADRKSKYELLGYILKVSPQIMASEWLYIPFLLKSLNEEDADIRISVQNALTGLTTGIAGISTENKTNLKMWAWKELAELNSGDNTTSSSSSFSKSILVKLVNSAFPFSDSSARMISVLASSPEFGPEVNEESRNGLDSHLFRLYNFETQASSKQIEFPSFNSFARALADEVGKAKSLSHPSIYSALPTAIEFAERLLVSEAVKNAETVVTMDQDWALRVEKALETNLKVRRLLVEKLDQVDVSEGVSTVLNISIRFLIEQFHSVGAGAGGGKSSGYAKAAMTTARLLSFASAQSVAHCIPAAASGLVSILVENAIDEKCIVNLCKIFGIVFSQPSFDQGEVLNAIRSLENSRYKDVSALSRCYLISRLVGREAFSLSTGNSMDQLLQDLLVLLDGPRSFGFAVTGIIQLTIYGALGPQTNGHGFVSEVRSKIQPKLKRFDEKSVLLLGHFSLTKKQPRADVLITDAEEKEEEEDEKEIFNYHNSKDVETIFAAGEALALVGGGWNSKLVILEQDARFVETRATSGNSEGRLQSILDAVLTACKNTKPSLRRAGCIWLLQLVQNCGHLFPVNDEMAFEIQQRFMSFLADKDDLVQDAASRGLGLLYEQGGAELKEGLVKSLLKSFTQSDTSAYTAGSVQNDTQLFEADVMRTNDGSISTYKDVLNLAQEAGDPSLVYKFMSVAKSSALWSSRRGIAYGLESILAQSSLDQLLSQNENFSKRLLPKLYRYRFDPYTSVSQSMEMLWKSLVKDSSKVIDNNFKEFLSELLKGMENKEWRTRQASTTAMNDLLQVVDFQKYEDDLNEIWGSSFRVMDDIKGSVRNEGSKLTKSLASSLIKRVEKSKQIDEKATNLLGGLIEFLLGRKGLGSDSNDVKEFSITTILKLCKTKSKVLKPYIPVLVENFILQFSSMEPEIVNYLALNASKYNIDNNELDANRLKQVGHSSLMDAIDYLLSQLDSSLMPKFLSRLHYAIKYSVGLPSKVSGSKVLISLVVNHKEIVEVHADALLDMASNQLKDRNETVVVCYAAAAGYICRLASFGSVERYSHKISKLYFEPKEVGDERSRFVASVASESVSKYAGERFSTFASAFLPLAFIGKFDGSERVGRNFEREWTEHATGQSSVKLYVTEILNYTKDHIKTNEFAIRVTLAKSLTSVCTALSSMNPLSKSATESLLDLLLESNKGKSWDGKEFLLQALVDFAIASKAFLDTEGGKLEQVESSLITEIKRRNPRYQRLAVVSCGKFIHNISSVKVTEVYLEVVKGLVAKELMKGSNNGNSNNDDDDMEDVEMELEQGLSVSVEERRLQLMEDFARVVPSAVTMREQFLAFACETIKQYFNPDLHGTWRTKVKASKVAQGLLSELYDGSPRAEDDFVDLWRFLAQASLSLQELDSVKIELIRFSKELQKVAKSTGSKTLISDSLAQFKASERSSVVRAEIDRQNG